MGFLKIHLEKYQKEGGVVYILRNVHQILLTLFVYIDNPNPTLVKKGYSMY
jgi:hypothetical protein